MSNRAPYPNPPITEAVIDIRTRPADHLSLDKLESLHASVKEDYPGKAIRNWAQGRFEIGKQVSASAAQETVGFLFKSADEKQIFQARFDGLTLSRLDPYQGWGKLSEEARRLWALYREATNPKGIERLAVRYINRIDIPGKSAELKDYFRTTPEVSSDLPQQLEGFFMQLRLPADDIRATVLINQTIIPPAREGVVSVALDIDVFRSKDLPQEEQPTWEYFEVLHHRKNKIFEACITDQARELFQ